MSRTIAIGDIHGCRAALVGLLEAISVAADDTLVPLGDYVDRGPDSKGVLEQLIALQDACRLIPILGNHDQLMLEAREGPEAFSNWLDSKGRSTLESYGAAADLADVPDAHFAFLEHCLAYWQSATHLFLHANYDPPRPLEETDPQTLRWLSLRDYLPPERHCSGKTAVVGHTPQDDVLDRGYLLGLDTGVCKGGWLTAWEVRSGEIWQVDAEGRLRTPS